MSLQVTSSGSRGQVTTDPLGIECGDDWTQRYTRGTRVTLAGEVVFCGFRRKFSCVVDCASVNSLAQVLAVCRRSQVVSIGTRRH
jgi:hypothetical protein